MWRPSDSTEAAAHRRTAEEIGEFSLAPSRVELFTAGAVAVVAITLLAIWGPDAVEAVLRRLAEQ